MKKEVEVLSWVLRGKQRREVLTCLGEAMTPTEAALKSGYSVNNTSRVLRGFHTFGIANLLNPKEKTGRLYELTPLGKELRKRILKR